MYKLIINLKTYKESTGKNAIRIAKAVKELEKEAKRKGVEIILCPQDIDIRDLVRMKVKVFAQHDDSFSFGAHTGYSIPDALKDAGVAGTLVSHSEHMLTPAKIKEVLAMNKKTGLVSCVCARTDKVAKEIAVFKPEFIAVEPKELIGGDISIATAKPELIRNSLKAVGKVPLLVGAGVKNREDVRISVKLGAKGILVASGVVKAKSPKRAIAELLAGF